MNALIVGLRSVLARQSIRRPLRPGLRWRPRLWLALLLSVAMPALAQSPLEVGVKAAYLYKFLAYVDWPESASAKPAGSDAALTIGVIGADPLFAELQKVINGRQVNGRPVTARKLAAGEAPNGLNALFIGREAAATALASGAKGRSVLIVTDAPDGLPDGAMLNFVLVDGRVRFEASAVNAERAGLRLSARLLEVAERVVSP